MEEEKEATKAVKQQQRSNFSGNVPEAIAIQDIKTENLPRVKTQMEEVNHVLGGGIVPGSLILIGSDPGIGKSTLLLQVSAQINQGGHRVLYISERKARVRSSCGRNG